MLLEAHRMKTSNKRVRQVESEFSSLKYIRFHLTLGISLDLSSFIVTMENNDKCLPSWTSIVGDIQSKCNAATARQSQCASGLLWHVWVANDLSQFSVAELLEVPGSKPSPKSAT